VLGIRLRLDGVNLVHDETTGVCTCFLARRFFGARRDARFLPHSLRLYFTSSPFAVSPYPFLSPLHAPLMLHTFPQSISIAGSYAIV
jgi:hypothetical protein